MQKKILAIETSCDETSAAIVTGDGKGPVSLLAHTVYSQMKLHEQYGGVFPEAASREHVRKIGVVIEETLRQFLNAKAHPKTKNLQEIIKNEIDAIAVTAGPGLIGSLLVGVNTAKTLAYAFDKPLIAVNHHEGHLMAAWITPQTQSSNDKFQIPKLPAIGLVVSGGHTMLLLIKDYGDFEVIGRTRDDAVGEAFDKTARLLGLPYPGGPALSALAEQVNSKSKTVNRNITKNYSLFTIHHSLRLPRPMLDSGDFDFSFSGLKTAVAKLVHEAPLSDDRRVAIAYEFQEAAIDVLVQKTLTAVKKYHPKSVIMAGGVAANKRLRTRLAEAVNSLPITHDSLPMLHIPPISLCTDNAAMIGAAAIYHALANRYDNWYDVKADDHWQIGT